MITYHVLLNNKGFYHGFPFYTREAAEQFRVALGDADYGIFEKVHKIETEDEREEREKREFENDLLENFLETGHDAIQL